MLPAVRNTEIAVSKEFIQTILEEKLGQFGFKDTDQVIKIDLVPVENDPEKFWMKVKHQKQKEVEVISRSNGSQLPKRE